jgi:hypothetical protein
MADYPDAKTEIDLLVTTLAQILQLLPTTEVNANGHKWEQLADTVETEMKILHEQAHGQELYTALLRLFSSVYKETRHNLQENNAEPIEAAIHPELPDLDHLLKHKRKLRKLWQDTRDPKLKTEINWVSKIIRRMVRGKAYQGWKTTSN